MRRLALVGFALWVAAPSCTTDHGALAKGSGGAVSTGGRVGLGGGGRGGALVIAGGTNSGGVAGRAPDEPPGANVLTIVHGIVDAAEVRLCFRAGRGAERRYVETPSGAESLGFGNKLVLRALEGVDFEADDLAPLAITGDLSLVEELDCEDAVERAQAEQEVVIPPENAGGVGGAGGMGGNGGGSAGAGAGGVRAEGGAGGADIAFDEHLVAGAGGAGGAGGAEPPLPDPPRLRVGELPAVPAGTLASGRSFLFVMNGCIGGPAFAGRLADDACGPEYSQARPSLGAAFVAVSRKSSYAALGLQVLQASVASTEELAVQSAEFPVGSQISALIALDLLPGAIQPRVPRSDLDRAGWGAGLPGWRIEVLGGGSVVRGVPWEKALALGGLETVDTGRNYVLVLIGPRFDLTREGFWNTPTVTIVESDPSE